MPDPNDHAPDPWDFRALDCAVASAEAGAQATSIIWQAMDPSDQDRWLESREFIWPRFDVFLKSILPAAERILAEEGGADSR